MSYACHSRSRASIHAAFKQHREHTMVAVKVTRWQPTYQAKSITRVSEVYTTGIYLVAERLLSSGLRYKRLSIWCRQVVVLQYKQSLTRRRLEQYMTELAASHRAI